MCHACSALLVPNGAWMTPLHKDMSRSGQVVRVHIGDGDKGMNQTELQECHTWISTVQRRVGAKKCQAAAPPPSTTISSSPHARPDGGRTELAPKSLNDHRARNARGKRVLPTISLPHSPSGSPSLAV